MQDNDDILAPPYARVNMMEDMLCLELGIVPISLCIKNNHCVSDLLKSMSPEDARRMTRKWRKIKRQSKKRSPSKNGSAERARWKIRMKAWDLVS
jgi:hypothetical protein